MWSAALTAMLFSILETLKTLGINPHTWLTGYLQACAEIGGKAPNNIDQFLPWNNVEKLDTS